MTKQDVIAAIERSVSRDEIVTVRVPAARWDAALRLVDDIDSVGAGEMENNDYATIRGGDNRLTDTVTEIREMWGVMESGDDWRVHLYRIS